MLAGGTWGILQLTRPPHPPEATSAPEIAVETLSIRSQAIANTLELSGTIRPIDQATLSTRVMGRITQLSLESGDRFRKGAVLAQIDVTDISAKTDQARSGVVQAQAGVVQAQAELSRSQATLSQLDAQKIEAQAALQLAKIDQGRMASLRAEGAVSQERLDQANTALAQAQAKVVQVEAGVRQAKAAIGQSRAAVDQSQSSVHQAESGVASASISESYGTVIAPFDGVVVQKLAYEGEMAAPGTALLKVENPDRLQLEIAVPEENVRFVRVGQPVKVRSMRLIKRCRQRFSKLFQLQTPILAASWSRFRSKIPAG
jgi:multidrug resistance efflux pump